MASFKKKRCWVRVASSTPQRMINLGLGMGRWGTLYYKVPFTATSEEVADHNFTDRLEKAICEAYPAEHPDDDVHAVVGLDEGHALVQVHYRAD